MYMKLVAKSKVYIDLSALERPFDDQRYYRIHLETTALGLVLLKVRQGAYTLYYSPVHEDEMSKDLNEMRREDIQLFLKTSAKYAKPFIKDNDRLEARAWELRKAGLGIADAFHVAYAEAIGADFITCDDELIKRARRCKIEVWYGTPVDFCQKENIA